VVLQDLPGVDEAVLYGAVVHVIVDPGLGREAVMAALEDAGLTIRAVRLITPSLEDVFSSVLSQPA
jgi:ribosomal protein S11